MIALDEERLPRTAAILLAAGESSRMGTLKALLPWLGTTLVAYQLEQMLLAGLDAVVVVLGHQADRVSAALLPHEKVSIVVNPHYREGRSTSIRRGVEALHLSAESVLIHSVDQPRRASTLSRLVEGHRSSGKLITLPSFEGRRGHPPVISLSLRSELAAVADETEGLRDVIRRHWQGIGDVEVESPEISLNLNTPEDYRSALAFFEAASP